MEEEITEELLEELGVPEEVLEELEAQTTALSEEEVLAICKDDLSIATDAKDQINIKIEKWKDLYEGKPLGNETDGRSKYVAKESQKAINWWIPNAMKPFMSSNEIVDFSPRTFDDVDTAKSQNTLLNYQFNNDFEKYAFLYRSLQCFSSEGTVVARTGWIHEDEDEVIPFEGFTQQQVAELEAQGAEIEIEDQAVVEINEIEGIAQEMIFKGTASITKTTVSRPSAEVIKIEDFFIIGETIDTSDACIQRIDTNRSDLRLQDKKYNPKGIYKNVDDIIVKNHDDKESGLAQDRQNDLENHGAVEAEDDNPKARENITIYEYYGNIDMDGDGISEPIVCVWASDGTILRVAENPFPDELPPFIGTAFMPIAFSFFGNALPHYLED
ncbi:MAG: portal protein, partial [Candidatus Thorarchaeota archaeon]